MNILTKKIKLFLIISLVVICSLCFVGMFTQKASAEEESVDKTWIDNDIKPDEDILSVLVLPHDETYTNQTVWEKTMENDFSTDVVSFTGYKKFTSNKISYLTYENNFEVLDYIYSRNNIKAIGKGFTNADLEEGEEGENLSSITNCFYVGDYRFVFNKMSFKVDGEFTSAKGFFRIDISFNNTQWEKAFYTEDLNDFNVDKIFDKYVSGAKYLFVKLTFKDAIISNVFTTFNQIETVALTGNEELSVSFDNNLSSTEHLVYDNKTFDNQAIFGSISSENAVYSNGILGGDYDATTNASSITFRFDTGDSSRYIREINPKLTMKVNALVVKEISNYLAFYMSFDDGKTFTKVSSNEEYKYSTITEDQTLTVTATFVDGDGIYNTPQVIEGLKNGANSLLFKIEYYGEGFSYSDCGIKDLFIKILYSDALDRTTFSNNTLVYNGGIATSNVNEPKRSGYKFVGWYLTPDFTGAVVDPTSSLYTDKDYTFYAKWKRTEFNITYVLNGGKNADFNISSIGENEYIKFGDATKDGYYFAGWYDATGNKVVSLQGEKVDSDIVLYAVFAEKNTVKGGCSGSFNGAEVLLLLVPVAVAFVLIKIKRKDN